MEFNELVIFTTNCYIFIFIGKFTLKLKPYLWKEMFEENKIY